jgi:ABC-type Na+ transport system ATPase subunit NatA
VVYEKINHVRDAYELVGVNLQTYLLQWNTYFGLNSLITAGAMTAISIYWKIFPLSSPTLIFFSHLLGLLYLNSLFIIYMQVQVQEEAAQGKPWIVGILSMAIGSVLLVFAEPTSTIFYVLSAVLPGVSIMQYFGIYITYDAAGYDTGIHLRNNVISSGLLGSYFAQLFGLAFYLTLTSLYSSQRLNDWLTNNHKAEGMQDVTIEDEQDDSSDRFEPLVPGSEVVISVRGLEQTYMPARFSCNRAQEPVRVLKGLDLDVCRGEVFGYLGHNGAGKTTSINIMTGEMKMQHGSIQYHFRDGTRSLQNPNDRHTIRTNIGVCPQHNTALQNDMTAREFLRLIAYLKGGIDVSPGQSPTDAVEAEVQRRLTEISFTSAEDADKLIDTYSGGMKRKVLIAMALIGNPDLVFLDEVSGVV